MSEDGSWEARHARAIDVYRTIRSDPAVDLEGAAKGMEAIMGPLGSLAMDHVLGDIWSRPELRRRDRSLVSVVALTCVGAERELRTHLNGALNHGASREELEEVFLHVSAYAGFPRAFDGMRVALEVFKDRDDVDSPMPRPGAARSSDAERHEAGLEAFGRLLGGRVESDAIPDLMRSQVGEVGRFALDYLFGQIWSRPQLSRRDRSLVTLTVLVTLGKVAELAIHVPGGLEHGLTREEIEEVILQLTLYAGYPAAVEAMRAAREHFG